MARRFNLFNFLEKKVDTAEISAVTQKILEQLAFKEMALFIGISYIANTLSKCEFKVYENNKEVKNELYYRLNVSPNPNENSSQFINKIIEQYYYHGSAIVVPHGQHIYCADDFDIEDDNPLKEYEFYNVRFNNFVTQKRYRSSDLFYYKLDNTRVKRLVDSIYMQYGEVISLALANYKRTNAAKYKMILENYKAGDKNFQEQYNKVLKEQLKVFLENDNAVYPQFKGIDLQEFSSKNPKDTSDIISMRKEIFDVTAQALKIPLPMMYGNITNMNEIVKVYLSICIDPLADMISEENSRKYYGYYGWKNSNHIKVDTSCINHVDILEIADKVDKIVSSGVVNIDELRNRLGMPELGTEFSTSYFMTKNFSNIEDILNNLEGGDK